ncbi:hypothetical protein Q4485_05920 [Granulosicoccaceae sp. 1_MG-2023]|nr:hypothetical protein [Granulosicoccaceae sp. 1_MG-2023]
MSPLPYVLMAALSSAGVSATALADTPAEACSEAARLAADGDIDGALEEARWCVESLQQLKQDATVSGFPDEVAGFRGGEPGQQSAMGMTVIERVYSRDGSRIDVTLTQGGNGGGLAALAQMGMSMGGGRKMRIQRYTVMDTSEGADLQLTVALDNGGILGLSSDSVDKETLTAFLKAFPIAAIDN